ncbi:spore germination protein [Bacillus sp. NTK074B]|uniref:spore germination protein n=1 Tax=Bacillus sp. NTK074B TaxID=2802174 RepID=UPI001A8D9CF1|nr:spore germination protein [Bacillus sp. NTK074B]
MKVNSISGNGSITIGEAVHNSHTANNKSQGINSSYGDTSPTESMMENVYIDPDVNDQTSVANADSVNAGAPLPVPVPVDPREAEKEDPHAVSDQHI